MPPTESITRYRAFVHGEEESAALYQLLAKAERDPQLATIYTRMAAVEQRHRAVWAEQLHQAGATVPAYSPSWRVRALGWMAQRFGAGVVLPIVSTMERDASIAYAQEPVAVAADMPQEERAHERVFRALQGSDHAGVAGPVLARLEGRHRATGGNALRAAVLGASDGLTSNLSLVMGVAGANLAAHAILLTGFAGLLAGGLSMAIGEWLSVQSARELYERQITVERLELEQSPDDEREELALIYQAKGIDQASAEMLARQIIAQGNDVALDTLAREELGLDPKELGGSPWVAAITSLLLFSVGAIIPVLPFLFGSGGMAIIVSLIVSVLGLFVIGVGISLTTGVSLIKAGGRQVVFGLLAAAVTFGLGKLIGGRL